MLKSPASWLMCELNDAVKFAALVNTVAWLHRRQADCSC